MLFDFCWLVFSLFSFFQWGIAWYCFLTMIRGYVYIDTIGKDAACILAYQFTNIHKSMASSCLLQHSRYPGTFPSFNNLFESIRRSSPLLPIHCIRLHLQRQTNSPLSLTRCTNPHIQLVTFFINPPTPPNHPMRRRNTSLRPRDPNIEHSRPKRPLPKPWCYGLNAQNVLGKDVCRGRAPWMRVGGVEIQPWAAVRIQIFPRGAGVVSILSDHCRPEVVQEDTYGLRGCVWGDGVGAAVSEEGFEEEAG